MDGFILGFKEFGLAGLLAGSGTLILFMIIKWILRIMEKILDRSDKQQEAFAVLQQQWVGALNDHTTQAKAFHDEVKQAHEYQRLEHLEFLKVINKCQKD